ncbi:MAG: PEGA domain-containing protein [Smithella sp.]|jgi:hypothetical protein
MKKTIFKRLRWTNLKKHYISPAVLAVLAMIIFGCATAPPKPYVPPTITINTIPSGADISIKGNYTGVSPVTIPAPANYRGNEPIKIEARLEGYEPKDVLFGDYHPPVDEVLKKMVETSTMIYAVPAGTKTIPAYYTYTNRINIKLYPKAGSISDSATPPDVQKSASAPRVSAGVYKATRSYSNGDKYVGEFVNGQFNGNGIYTYANGDKYEGEFVAGKFTGQGTFSCRNAKPFIGNLENKVPLELTVRCN